MPVQRWRLTFARGPDAPDLTQREQAAAWAAALEAAGLSDACGSEPARLMPAAAIPNGLTSDAELADLLLPIRRTAADVRERLTSAMPAGNRLVELYDVWVGEPALPALVEAADYRVTLDAPDVSDAALSAALERVLAATALERARAKAGAASANLRPLIAGVRILSDGSLRMRLRFDPALGTGRPEEVVAALADILGRPLQIASRHRERLWLRGEERPDLAEQPPRV